MSKGIMAAGVVLIGIVTLVIVNVIQNSTSGNELDYYLLKETTEAAMIDAVDLGYYRMTGLLRIDKEKFMENFIRRFSESASLDRDYDIKVYDLNETPPKVSIKVGSSTSATFNAESLNIVNTIDAILETKYEENRILEDLMKEGKLNYE